MNHDTLILVHVVFRHGDKVPDNFSVYPNDPYKNEDYHPYTQGQLTNNGIKAMETLGSNLREKYKGFLGDTYNGDILDLWTSTVARCKTSLELVLGTLFPPPKNQSKCQTVESNTDAKMFLSVLCHPIAVRAYEDYMGVQGRHILESKSELLKYIGDNSGLVLKTIRDAALLVNALLSQHSMGLSLPDWIQKIWPDALLEILHCEYDIVTSTASLKFFSVGLLLEKIIEDSKAKIDDKSARKLHMYSGHDVTLATLMRCLGAKKPPLPSYGANLIIELHKIDGVFGYKIYYQWTLEHEAESLAFGENGTFWPFESFVGFSQEILDQKQLNPDF